MWRHASGHSHPVNPATAFCYWFVIPRSYECPTCVEKVGWQRSNSSADFSVEGSDLLGDSTLIFFNEPEYAEDISVDVEECSVDDEVSYVCDDGQRTTCSGGLYTNATTQTESPCLRGWNFFNLQRDGEIRECTLNPR